MSICIRLANFDDLPALLALDHLAQQPESGREAFIRRVVAASTGWVAILEGAVAGYGALEYTFYECGLIAMLYIHQDYRRRGVGHALLEHFEMICQTPKLFTSTNLSNLPMQALLAKREYTLSGVIHNLDEDDPELVYFKRVR
jgi:N-acetylglutamate synthase-like GNAT family acetyltransferase